MGNPRRRVHLLHLEPRRRPRHRAFQSGPGRGAEHRQPEPEDVRQPRPDSARRDPAAHQAALHRRRSHPRAHLHERPLRLLRTAPRGRPGARRRQAGAGRLGRRHHRRQPPRDPRHAGSIEARGLFTLAVAGLWRAGRLEPASRIRQVLQRQPRVPARDRRVPAHRCRRARRGGGRRQRAARLRPRRRRGRRRRRRAFRIRRVCRPRPLLSGRHPGHLEAKIHQRHRRCRPRAHPRRSAQGHGDSIRRRDARHAELRRDGRREVQRAALPHADRRDLGQRADLDYTRLPRIADRVHRHPGHAGADADGLLPLRLHAQPHHAVRADLLHRHPGGRRHRGG